MELEKVDTVAPDKEEELTKEPFHDELSTLRIALCKIPAVTILAGGSKEELAKKEVLYSVRQGWPVIILQGSGELPDEIFKHHNDRQTALTKINIETRRNDGRGAQPPRLPYISDPDLAEIVIDGKLTFIPAEADAEELRETILKSLPDPWAEDVLNQAWERFERISCADDAYIDAWFSNHTNGYLADLGHHQRSHVRGQCLTDTSLDGDRLTYSNLNCHLYF
ncbi:MAG: hypothetical protein AMJ56_06800 [Anaerolineae bacterium SG8_19]|nr:MAG: hypothetical protein AMJ56_06800 [Anaerolineae bacterium SG8_19]